MKYLPPEEDELLEEIGAFLARPESGKIYQLNYPTLTRDSLDLDGNIVEAMLRPECQQLELVRRVKMNKLYNESLGEQLALNVDGAHRDRRDAADNKYPSGVMDRSVLRSEGSLPDVERYATGRIVPGVGLVITPVDASLLLVPVQDYIDMAETRVKNEKKAEEEAEEGISKDDVTRAVTVRFERAENERMKNARERSFVHHQRKIQEEPWFKMEYTGLGDSYGEHLNKQIYHSVESEKVDQFHLPASHYLSLLVSPSTSATVPSAAACTSMLPEPLDIPKSTMSSFTLEKQIEKLMRRVGVARYCEILDYLNTEVGCEEASLIEKVQMSATLVQGCWVLKSDLLYPTGSPDANAPGSTGMPTLSTTSSKEDGRRTQAGTLHSDMQKVREYALYLLTTRGFMEREELLSVASIAGEDLLQMFKFIAKPIFTENNKASSRWTFLLDRDQHFIDKYKDVSQRYIMKWDYQFQSRVAPR